MEEEPPLVGYRIGNFTLTRLVGEGAMGRVYLAEHDRIDRQKAVKVLRRQWTHHADSVSRFFDEASAATACQHDHIVTVDDCGTFVRGGQPHHYIVMEYLEGRDVGQECQSIGSFPVLRAVRIIACATAALAVAHQRGIVHRDLKPGNLFLSRRGGRSDYLKVLDFGIARLTGEMSQGRRTRTGEIMGTPEYMSPEQANGLHPDPRSDVFSLGVVLYYMLAGRAPFAAETFILLAAQITREPAPPLAGIRPDLPPGVLRAVEQAMAKRPEDRFASMRAFQSALLADDAVPQAATAMDPATIELRSID